MSKIQDLLNRLNDPNEDPWKRAEAALELGDWGDETVIPDLIRNLKEAEHDFIRRDCAEALGYWKFPLLKSSTR